MKHGREKIQEEAQRYLVEQKMQGERFFEKWRRTEIGYGLDDIHAKNPAKAHRVAKAIEMQEAHLKKLNETIISQSFSTSPENVLKIVRIGTANSHRGDIFTDVQLSTTDDALYFIDMTYENTPNDKEQTAGEKMYEEAYYTSGGTAGEVEQVGDDTTSNTITANNAPILPNKVHISVDGELCAYDDGSGALTIITGNGAGITGGTVTVATGAVAITSSVAIASTSTIRLNYEWDSEESTLSGQYPKIALTVSKKRFNATPQPLGYSYTTMTEILLGTAMGQDAEELLIGAVADEHAKYKDYKAIALAQRVARSNTTYAFDANFAAAGEVSDKAHAQKILSVIGDIGGDLYDEIKRGQVNRIVCGSRAITYLMKHDLFVPDTTANQTGVYHGGNLAGIEVYVCPADAALVANNEMLLTFKNPNEGLDVGLAFGTLTEISASLTYPTFYTDANIASVSDEMIINRSFVKKLSINNLPTYSV